MVSLQVTSKPSKTWSLGDPQFLLDAQTMTPNRLEDTQSSKVTSMVPHRNNLFSDAQSLWGLWVFGFGFSSLDDFHSKSSEDGLLSNDKCQFLSEQPTS